jgi:hypothetical protein
VSKIKSLSYSEKSSLKNSKDRFLSTYNKPYQPSTHLQHITGFTVTINRKQSFNINALYDGCAECIIF